MLQHKQKYLPQVNSKKGDSSNPKKTLFKGIVPCQHMTFFKMFLLSVIYTKKLLGCYLQWEEMANLFHIIQIIWMEQTLIA